MSSLRLPFLLSLCGAALPGQDPLQKRIDQALGKVRPILLERLKGQHNGPLALLCLAALHDGIDPDEKVLDKALKRLRRARLGRTYDLSLRLMVLADLPRSDPDTRLALADCRRLLRNEYRRGGFGYNSRDQRWDLSNTQYAILGLRAAKSLGAKIDTEVWQRSAAAATRAQHAGGGFGYTEGGRRPTVSMTTAGIAVLQVCAAELDPAAVGALEVKRRLREAWDYMADQKIRIGDAETANCLYFHYGLERACILSEVGDIDGKDWYRSGAEMLCKTQLRGGGWHSSKDLIEGGRDRDGSDVVSTSFAVLFLRRKFRRVISGPLTGAGAGRIADLQKGADKQQIAAVVKDCVGRGLRGFAQVIAGLESPLRVQRVAAARVLLHLAKDDFGFNPYRGAAQNAEALKAIRAWWQARRVK